MAISATASSWRRSLENTQSKFPIMRETHANIYQMERNKIRNERTMLNTHWEEWQWKALDWGA